MIVPDTEWQVSAASWLIAWLALGSAARELLARHDYDRRTRR